MRHPKVLVTDDDSNILCLETMLLEEEGYEVFEATTGNACLEVVRTHHPDLVLLDVMLPDVSGLDVCRQIKTDRDLSGAFVILVSGVMVSSDYRADGLEVGADDYMIKPLASAEFLARVRSMIRIKRAEDGLREKEKAQQRLISDLQKALGEIKTLKGLLPICPLCKKIRDDKGYWNQLEVYISAHTDAILTHGVCPHCAEGYRAEIRRLIHRR
jgi:DNA-binding response OmpR family regulator